MKKLIYILLIFNLQSSTLNLYSQWVIQNSGTTQHLYDVYFINTQTGWACGNIGTVLKTTNGGNNWIAQASGVTQSIQSVHFANLNTGWMVTRVQGKILKSTNGGSNWNIIFETNRSFQQVYFTDSLYGWVAEFAGRVYMTTNGGNSWDSAVASFGLNDVYFFNRTTGWACGIGIYKSTDGGTGWIQQLLGVSQTESITFININTGWAVDQTGYRIYKTTNSGSNWALIDSVNNCFNAHSIFFTSSNSGWVSGDCGQLFSTTNGGFNWYQQNTGTTNFLSDVCFVNDSIGWSVGGGGIIIHTSNGGAIVSVNVNNEIIPSEYKLYQNYPNPFNPITIIAFDLPEKSHVNLSVYDVLGKLISILVDEILPEGTYSVKFNGVNLSSGVYLYKLTTENFTGAKKMLLIK